MNERSDHVHDVKVIVVTGCTGTGKTKLGIELAKQYDGEVISADSMQIYKGLDIITNTVTNTEADGIIHHCISYVEPHIFYNISMFVQHTIPIVKDILKRNKTPIIVGGTAYYIEALIWDFTLPTGSIINEKNIDENQKILNSDSLSDYEKLNKVDPDSAKKLHPNNLRKIRRSLDIFRLYGCTQSSLFAIQHGEESNRLRGKLRWDNVLLFSVECNPGILDVRLDKRVDEMVNSGLQAELATFLTQETDCHSGLFSQVIGFKEFDEYLHLKRSQCDSQEVLNRAFSEGIQKMKVATRKYSRKQIKWIHGRLENDQNCKNYHFYRLDTSFPDQWSEVISKPVHKIVNQFMEGSLQQQNTVDLVKPKPRIIKTCEMCNVTCESEDILAIHLKSRRHKRKREYENRKPHYQKMISKSKV